MKCIILYLGIGYAWVSECSDVVIDIVHLVLIDYVASESSSVNKVFPAYFTFVTAFVPGVLGLVTVLLSVPFLSLEFTKLI